MRYVHLNGSLCAFSPFYRRDLMIHSHINHVVSHSQDLDSFHITNRRKGKQNRTWNSKPSFCSSPGTQLGDEADVTLRGNYQPRTQAWAWESWDELRDDEHEELSQAQAWVRG